MNKIEANEISQPLMAIGGYSELIGLTLSKADFEGKETIMNHLEKMIQQVNQLSILVRKAQLS